MAVSYAPGLRYDARSLVPDVGQDLGNIVGTAMGVARERRTDRQIDSMEDQLLEGAEGATSPQQAGPDAEGDVIGPPAPPKVKSRTDFLMQPENVKILRRMEQLRPGASKFMVQFAQQADERALQQLKDDSVEASRTFQAFIDIKEPAERNRWLAARIREREEQGKDASRLREMIGLKPDQQTLRARAGIIMAGDGEMLATNGLKSMAEMIDYQNKVLEHEQRRRDFVQGKQGDVSEMRKEFTGLSKPYIEMRDAFQKIEAASGRDSPAGDLALVFNYMKILDPGSTVREGEQADARNAAGVPDQIRNLYNRAATGERLSPAQRADFKATARSLFQRQQATQDRMTQRFRSMAERRGLPADDVVADFTAPETTAGEVTAPMPQVKEGTVIKNPKTGERRVWKGGKWQPVSP